MSRQFDVPGLKALGISPADIARWDDGASLIKTATVTLTNDQILALPTTPVVIIPATEVLNYSGNPSKLFYVVKAYAILNAAGGTYSNCNITGTLQLGWGSDFSNPIAISAQVYGPGLQGTGIGHGATFEAFSFFIAEVSLQNDATYDNAIVIKADNAGDGNYTSGHPANTLKVVVHYFEVDI